MGSEISLKLGIEVVVGQREHRLAAHRTRLALHQLRDQPFCLLDRAHPVQGSRGLVELSLCRSVGLARGSFRLLGALSGLVGGSEV